MKQMKNINTNIKGELNKSFCSKIVDIDYELYESMGSIMS
jgi:hypothetical protein